MNTLTFLVPMQRFTSNDQTLVLLLESVDVVKASLNASIEPSITEGVLVNSRGSEVIPTLLGVRFWPLFQSLCCCSNRFVLLSPPLQQHSCFGLCVSLRSLPQSPAISASQFPPCPFIYTARGCGASWLRYGCDTATEADPELI